MSVIDCSLPYKPEFSFPFSDAAVELKSLNRSFSHWVTGFIKRIAREIASDSQSALGDCTAIRRTSGSKWLQTQSNSFSGEKEEEEEIYIALLIVLYFPPQLVAMSGRPALG